MVLGRISPKNFLGGAMQLDSEAAQRAVAKIAQRIGKDVEETALAIVRIANTNMVGALRAVLIERGQDPRDFTLLGFGGAGPPHTADLMVEAGIPHGLIPNHPGQFSAFGFTMTDARVDRHRTLQQTSHDFDRSRATATMQTLVEEALDDLRQQGYGEPFEIIRSLEMRYLGQNYELEVPVPFDGFDDDDHAETLAGIPRHACRPLRLRHSRPDDRHRELHGDGGVGDAEAGFHEDRQSGRRRHGRGTRRVVFEDGAHDTPVFDRAALRAGHRISGPAVIEEAASVTLLRPGQTAISR